MIQELIQNYKARKETNKRLKLFSKGYKLLHADKVENASRYIILDGEYNIEEIREKMAIQLKDIEKAPHRFEVAHKVGGELVFDKFEIIDIEDGYTYYNLFDMIKVG